MKTNLSINLVVEVTRRCKLKCDHCLRGPAQKKDMDNYMFRKVIKKFDDKISNLTLTGGEPLLNISVLKECVSLKNISSIYIATSGFVNDIPKLDLESDNESSSELFDALIMLKEAMYGELYIDISTDKYHNKKNYDFKEVCEMYGIELGSKDNTKYNEAIGMGRAFYNHIGFKDASEYLFPLSEEDDSQTLIVNIDGDVYPGCDYSYKAYKKFKKDLCIGNALTDSLDTILSNYSKLVGKTTKHLYYNENSFKILTEKE